MLDNLPNSWNDISLIQYEELMELELDNTLDGIELFCEQLAVLLDIASTDDEIALLESEEIFKIRSNLNWLGQEPKSIFIQEIDKYRWQDLNQLKLGEFIDIEYYMVDGYRNAPIIAAILYKQTRKNDWGNTEWEPYEYNLIERSENFKNLNICQILGIWETYRQWKEDFMSKYDTLFEDTSQEPEDWQEEELTGLEKLDLIKQEAVERARKQWSWENILWGLTNGDVSKFDAVFGCNVILVFNTLSMRKTLEI